MKQKSLNKTARSFAILIMIFFFHLEANAQSVTVEGTIKGKEDSLPIPGATIIVKNKKGGQISDFDGNYKIEAEIGDFLIFSYTGLETQEIEVSSDKRIDVFMKTDVNSLEEVVVIGYGSAKKKEVTGAITKIKSEDLESIVTPDLGTALQGQVAGVSVTSSDLPGEDSEIQIRGIATLNEGQNNPLFVVDGIPQEGNPRIPPTDIESLTILRDASSKAIYGIRGSAGVILITTKKGTPGTLRVRINSSYAVQDRNSAVPLMNSVEQTYFDVVSAANVNGTADDQVNLQLLQQPNQFVNETDLNDLVFNDKATTQNHNVNISGGSDDITYNVGFGFFDQEGLQINSGFQRFNMRANTVYTKNKLNIQANIAYQTEERDIPQGNLLSQSIVYRPTQNGLDLTTFDDLAQGGDDVNRLGWVLESLRTTNKLKRTRVSATANVNYEIIEGLSIRSNIGLTSTNDIGKTVRPYQEIFNTQGQLQSEPENSYVENRARLTTNFAGELGVNYEKTFAEDHKLTFTFFGSTLKDQSEAFAARRQGLTTPGSDVLNGSTGTQSATSGFDYTDTRIGLVGRIQYNYKDRYLVNTSIRRDGSSKFREQQWATFPAVSVGWNIAEEKFWSNTKSTVNTFKLRVSRGESGVDRTRSYSFSPVISQDINYYGFNPDTGNETLSLGAIQEAFANEGLGWETLKENNVGIDLGFFKNKLTVSADYYKTKNEDMLFPIFVPPSSGGGNNAQVVLNVGNMTNEGLELTAALRGQTGKVNWRMNGTFTTNKNLITRINGDTNFLLTNDSGLVGRAPQQSRVTALSVGHEAAAFYLWRTDGIIDTEEKLAAYQQIDNNARMGDTRFIDQNNDGILDDNDRVYSGSGLPKYEIGYTFNATYKSFDFSMNWYAALGQEIMNGFDAWAYGFGRHKDLVYQWSSANPVTPIPAYRNDIRRHPNYLGYSDLWLEDGSYLRLRQISLGYSIPRKKAEKWGFNRVRFYVRSQNPITITKYSGYNPEVGGGIAGRGLDKNTGPIAVQYMFGINLNF
ncbi:TonB-dependent receptor SusC [Kordia antarctica]|uniref:TonB-dependent receptor SusC n=1 Tax=Kordia antarctica TaxID=1218801 RepID=A0A7L4ZR87_9FLAO|nr:TonB-dependent receptor [Kordia antarctica]QHI39223.1 TonB-dependent receptor SusC [Kordia antarctica]